MKTCLDKQSKKITVKTSITIYPTKTSWRSQDTAVTSRPILSQSLWKQSPSTQARICLVFRGLPRCQPTPSPSHLSPTQRRGAGRRPTSAAGWLPEESNVTSGGTDGQTSGGMDGWTEAGACFVLQILTCTCARPCRLRQTHF